MDESEGRDAEKGRHRTLEEQSAGDRVVAELRTFAFSSIDRYCWC